MKGRFSARLQKLPQLVEVSIPIDRPPLRYDWVGRPEQTNMRLNNGGLKDVDDVRDLWNQQTPFAIAEELQPCSASGW